MPYGGDRPYVPPVKSHGAPKRLRGGAYEDCQGNHWRRDPSGHGGPHWDVEHSDGSHTNVTADGHVRGGDANDHFPRIAATNPPRLLDCDSIAEEP